tara:strand:+ start:763 stop:1083 length:321 start_codon:yes stop_codon:yes gene_type:complete
MTKSWTDKDMLEFARVASGGSYGDYKGCKSLQSKLEKYKLMTKDLNKHRQVKSVDSNTNTDIYSVDNEIVAMPNITALVIHLMKKYPNDAEFGKHVRATVLSWKEE